jgi:hypothetical protein
MRRLLAIACVVLGACGDNATTLSPDQLVARLGELGVAVQEQPTKTVGYHYYVLRFTQPVDHAHPEGATFQQEVSLLHRDTGPAAPMIVATTGYSDYLRDGRAELTALLAANQVSIEHRYFGASRPSPADWSKLTIEQAAADEHAIIEILRQVYGGAFVTTGASKGGMTAVYHRRFYPDDVEGTVPYVAPISFGAPDERYPAFVATLGPAACHAQVQAVATEMLAHRRAAFEAKASALAGMTFTRVAVGPAVEEAVASLEWQFWQYVGVGGCAGVPAVDADDQTLFAFLQQASPINADDDNAFFEAYVYQAYAQLGFPDGGAAYLDPYLRYRDADYAGELPTPKPAYSSAAMQDIDAWVKTQGDGLLFVYGGWDPWTGGKFTLGGARDSALFVVDQGTHGSKIAGLAEADRTAAFAKLVAWTGATPDLARLQKAAVAEPPRLRIRRSR